MDITNFVHYGTVKGQITQYNYDIKCQNDYDI
jgi:hypothetical protein